MNNVSDWKEIKPWEEAIKAENHQPYNCGEEQAQRMEKALGEGLNRKLEVMTAKLEVVTRIKERVKYDLDWLTEKNIGNWHSAYQSALKCIMEVLDGLEQETKAELK